MSSHVRKDDLVEVISGAHKGQRGKVLKVLPKEGKVLVQGVNMVYRHVRPSKRNPQGGRLQKEAMLNISNVLPVDSKTDKPTRVRFEIERDSAGKVVHKYRVAVKSGVRLSELTRPRTEAQ